MCFPPKRCRYLRRFCLSLFWVGYRAWISSPCCWCGAMGDDDTVQSSWTVREKIGFQRYGGKIKSLKEDREWLWFQCSGTCMLCRNSHFPPKAPADKAPLKQGAWASQHQKLRNELDDLGQVHAQKHWDRDSKNKIVVVFRKPALGADKAIINSSSILLLK